MYNKVIIMGRLTKAPELKTTPTGNAVCSFSVAVERKFVGKDGERQTDFFDCVAWRNTAEFVSRYFGKGAMILIDGELQTRSYTDKNGQERRVVEINVDNANFTGEKRDNAQSQYQQAPPVSPQYQQPTAPMPQYQQPPQYQQAPQQFQQPTLDDTNKDDYPF